METPEEWVDRLVDRLKTELILAFEERFIAIEEQLLTFRRYSVTGRFLEHANERLADLDNMEMAIRESIELSNDEKTVRLGPIKDCHSFIMGHIRLAAQQLRDSRDPERLMESLSRRWKRYFDQKGVPHPESLDLPVQGGENQPNSEFF